MRVTRSNHRGENNPNNKAALLNMLAAHGHVVVRVFWTCSQILGLGGMMPQKTYMGKVSVGLFL